MSQEIEDKWASCVSLQHTKLRGSFHNKLMGDQETCSYWDYNRTRTSMTAIACAQKNLISQMFYNFKKIITFLIIISAENECTSYLWPWGINCTIWKHMKSRSNCLNHRITSRSIRDVNHGSGVHISQYKVKTIVLICFLCNFCCVLQWTVAALHTT